MARTSTVKTKKAGSPRGTRSSWDMASERSTDTGRQILDDGKLISGQALPSPGFIAKHETGRSKLQQRVMTLLSQQKGTQQLRRVEAWLKSEEAHEQQANISNRAVQPIQAASRSTSGLSAIPTPEFISALKRGVFGVIDDRVVVEKAREGLPFAEFERLAGVLELNTQEQAAILSINERTMARRIAERGNLHPLESERLVLLQKLAEYGVEVFEDVGKFNRWLRRPLPLLGGKSPLQYLDMSTGFVVVEQVLGRLAHGVYS